MTLVVVLLALALVLAVCLLLLQRKQRRMDNHIDSIYAELAALLKAQLDLENRLDRLDSADTTELTERAEAEQRRFSEGIANILNFDYSAGKKGDV